MKRQKRIFVIIIVVVIYKAINLIIGPYLLQTKKADLFMFLHLISYFYNILCFVSNRIRAWVRLIIS